MRASFSHFFGALRSGLRPQVEGIYPDVVFKALLKRECAVAERNSQCVTVLAFYSTGERIKIRDARVLGGIFADRLRATDFIGWLDARTIGVILPHTQVKDASLVADQVCRRMLPRGVKLDYKFYLYPHDECGKWDKDREFPLTNNCDCAPAAGCGPEQGHRDEITSSCNGNGEGVAGMRASVRPMADISSAPIPAWKRVLDIALCVFGLVFFGPLMLMIALGIKIVAPGPVLFRQERIGYRGKPFMLFKFRSMKLNADTGVHQEHLAQLIKSDARLTKLDKADARLIPFGKLFRASGFDELPQLFNILRGDMSFIGPRPCVAYEYEQLARWHKHRCDTYPGLTGLWQVSGKNKTTFTEMIRLDIKYGHRQTLKEELWILVQTIPAVVGQIRDSSSTKGNT